MSTLTPVVYSEATTTAVSTVANFMIGTLTNFAPMILAIFALKFIFNFLAKRFSGR